MSVCTGALILVHYGGYPCDLDRFYALSRERGIPIVEDCAHACGATYQGKRIGGYEGIQAFSFHAVKNLPMADGGALTVHRPEQDARLRRLRWLGIDRDTFSRMGPRAYQWDYNVAEVGFKYHMNDLEAAIGLVQLRHLEADNRRRAAIAAQYREGLAGTPGIRCLRYARDRTSSFHLFCVLAEAREALVDKLNAAGVEVGVHYRRNDRYPMYDEQDLPRAEAFSRSVLSLPLHMGLSDEQVAYVIDTIRQGW